MTIKRLGDAELEIMLIVWSSPQPISASQILEQLKQKRKWSIQTLLTVLSRLVDKGFLVCQKQGRNNLYREAISGDAYKQTEGKSILERLYGNSFRSLVTSLYEGNAIQSDDLKDLRAFLTELEKEDESC